MTNSVSTPTKKKCALLVLCEHSYNRFEAERLTHNYCLHLTVSTIQNNNKIEVCWKSEMVSSFRCIETKLCHYWVALENTEQALKAAKFWG